jgi:hypothetical protein
VWGASACEKKAEDEPTATGAASVVAAPEPTPPAPAPTPAPTPETTPSPEAPEASPTAAAPSPADSTIAAAPSASAEPEKKPVLSAAASIQRCCTALDGAAEKGGLTKNQYAAASSVCKRLAGMVKEGSANAASVRTTLRAQLQGVPLPGGC